MMDTRVDSPAAGGKKKRILLVEDSPTQAAMVQHSLERAGFDAFCIRTAEEALETVNRIRPDLLLVDYHLPGMRGDELCRRMRMNFSTQGVPILMLTADNTLAAELHGLEAGADDYVAKSEDPEILMLRIRSLLRKSSASFNLLTPGEAFFRKARLLVVDDDPSYLKVLEDGLIAEGYAVDTASSGKEGLKRLNQVEYDCVLVDLAIPETGSMKIVEEMVERRKQDIPPTTALMINARESKEIARKALASGADDFISKSNDISLLKGRLRALLRHKSLHDQHRRIVEEFERRENDLERVVAERTFELKQEITERKKAEEAMRKAKELAETANHTKTEFLANMSHELRTPLNAIIGFSDMIRNQALGALPYSEATQRYLEYVDNIYDSGIHLLEIINDILDISRVEVGELTLNEEVLDLRGMLASAERLVRPQAEKAGVALIVAPAKKLPYFFGDGRFLKQTFVNLLYNALKFTPEGGKVSLGAHVAEDGWVEVNFIDTGIGIDKKDIDKVLKPFGQVDSSLARKHEGTGLGLPLSKTFVETHGGRLILKSRLGKGTTVTLRFPPDRVRADLTT